VSLLCCCAGSDEQQTIRSSEHPALDVLYQQAPAAAGNGHAGQQESEDEHMSAAEDMQQPAAYSIPQPQADANGLAAASKAAVAAAAAAANGVDEASGEEEEEDADAEGAEGAGDGQAKTKKRRGQKKKKKKKKKKGAAAAGDAEEGQQDSSSAPAAGVSTAAAPAAAAAAGPQAADEDEDNDEFFDVPETSDNEEVTSIKSSPASSKAAAGQPAAAAASRPEQINAAAGPALPDSFHSENYMEFFSDEPCAGTTHLPAQVGLWNIPPQVVLQCFVVVYLCLVQCYQASPLSVSAGPHVAVCLHPAAQFMGSANESSTGLHPAAAGACGIWPPRMVCAYVTHAHDPRYLTHCLSICARCFTSQTDEPQQPASLMQGPAVSACLDRHEHKGEDKGLKLIGATWTPEGSNGEPRALARAVMDCTASCFGQHRGSGSWALAFTSQPPSQHRLPCLSLPG
jgi:hypothetical protein